MRSVDTVGDAVVMWSGDAVRDSVGDAVGGPVTRSVTRSGDEVGITRGCGR